MRAHDEWKTQRTRSGIEVRESYSSRISDGDADANVESPGEYPFTRGRYGARSRNGGWIHRELSGEGSPRRSNEQIRYLLEKGQTGIDYIGDSPTQSNMDPDHPLAAHAVGTQGVSICCKRDYIELFAGIPLEEVSISSSVTAFSSVPGLCLAAKHYGADLRKLRGSALQIPLYAEDCSYATHLPCHFRARLSADCMEFCAEHMPKFHSYVEDTYFFSETGINAIQEMALGFIEIRHLTRKLIERGVSVDSFAPRIGLLVNCSMDFFEEIAKIRASRRLFAKMMKEEFGAADVRSMSAVVTSHTSGLTLTAQQPANNIVRGTVQAMALALAGVQAMEVSAFDEAYRTPSAEAHLVGLRTQQLIDVESGITKVLDPLGGSYYVESLTDEMENRIWSLIQEIEALGSPEDLADQGYFRRLFHQAMENQQASLRDGASKVVGVNIHTLPPEEDLLLRDLAESKIEPSSSRVEEIAEMKNARYLPGVKDALAALREHAAADKGNLYPLILDAMDADATTGEICGVLRLANGMQYDPFDMLQPIV